MSPAVGFAYFNVLNVLREQLAAYPQRRDKEDAVRYYAVFMARSTRVHCLSDLEDDCSLVLPL